MLPALDPPSVRMLSGMAASQGADVAIMGSVFEALELAAHCARLSSSVSSELFGMVDAMVSKQDLNLFAFYSTTN